MPTTTPDEFAEIRKLLMRMDYRPPSVQIDVTIAEVDLTNSMQYGVEWYLKSTGNWLADVTTNLGAALPQLSAGVISPNNSYATLQLLGAETSFPALQPENRGQERRHRNDQRRARTADHSIEKYQ